MEKLKQKSPRIVKLGNSCPSGRCSCPSVPSPPPVQSPRRPVMEPATEDQLPVVRERKRGRGVLMEPPTEDQEVAREAFGLREDQVPRPSSPKKVHMEPATEDQERSPPQRPVLEPPTDDQMPDGHPFRPAAGEKVIMTEAPKEPKLSKREFLADRKKVQAKRIVQPMVTNIKRLNVESIVEAHSGCQGCGVQTKFCKSIRYDIIRHIREQLYGPGVKEKTRIKILCQWLHQILEVNKVKCAEERKLFTRKSRLSEWFVYDFSFSVSSEVRRIDCCRDCFVRATGLSNETINKYLNLIRDGNLVLVTEEVTNLRNGVRKSPERMMVHAWLEMKVEEQACKAPDGKKSELPEIATRRNLHAMFKTDWEAGVLNGSYHRAFRGSRKRKVQKKPAGVPRAEEPRQVDEDGNLEPTDAEKLKAMCEHPVPSYQFFCRVWKEEFNKDYKIPRSHRRFTQCNWCAEIKENIKYAKDADKLYWQQCLYGHYAWLTAQREKYYKHQRKAEKQPHR